MSQPITAGMPGTVTMDEYIRLSGLLRVANTERNDAQKTSRDLRAEIESIAKERDMWKANHDNQVELKSIIASRPDLGDRAPRMAALIEERNRLRAEAEGLHADDHTEAERAEFLWKARAERAETEFAALKNLVRELLTDHRIIGGLNEYAPDKEWVEAAESAIRENSP